MRLPVATAVVVSMVMVLSVGSAIAAASGEAGTVLATGDRPVILGDLATADNILAPADNNIGVVWQKGNLSFIRWSADRGDTFAARRSLRGAGLEATDPRLATCGDFLWAASVWRSGDIAEIGIDWFAPGSAQSGRFTIGLGHSPDIACFGDVLGVTYSRDERLRLAIFEGPCANACVPASDQDLGTAPEFELATIAATDRGFVVARQANGILVHRFIVTDDGGGLDVSRKPAIEIGQEGWFPQVAADGTRVVVAYQRLGQTHLRISDNRGKSFGPRIIVSRFCRNCFEGSSSPTSVDVRGSWILVEVVRGMGVPPAIEMQGFFSINTGQSWTKLDTHTGGHQHGVLVDGEVAEAWDKHLYADPVYGDVPQELRFRAYRPPGRDAAAAP